MTQSPKAGQWECSRAVGVLQNWSRSSHLPDAPSQLQEFQWKPFKGIYKISCRDWLNVVHWYYSEIQAFWNFFFFNLVWTCNSIIPLHSAHFLQHLENGGFIYKCIVCTFEGDHILYKCSKIFPLGIYKYLLMQLVPSVRLMTVFTKHHFFPWYMLLNSFLNSF